MASKTVSLPIGGKEMAAYFSPAADPAAPGIVIAQEIFGVNANMRATADAFAAAGFNVIVPDLFWRQEPGVELDPAAPGAHERASTLMKGLDQPKAIDDIFAAAAYLRAAPGASGAVAVVGYCLGGRLAYLAAMREEIDAAVSYYGVAIQTSLDRAGELKRPLLLHIATEDHLCPADAQAAIHAALDGHAGVELIDHPGVGHAFARKNGAAFDAAAAECADTATIAFLQRHLGDAR